MSSKYAKNKQRFRILACSIVLVLQRINPIPKNQLVLFLMLMARMGCGQDLIPKNDTSPHNTTTLPWEIGVDLTWLSNTAEITPTIFVKKHQKSFSHRFMLGFRSRQKLDPLVLYLPISLKFDVENGERRDFLVRYGVQKPLRTAGKLDIYLGLDYEFRYKVEEGILFGTDSTYTKTTYSRLTSSVNGHGLLAVLGIKYSPISNLSISIENDAGLYHEKFTQYFGEFGGFRLGGTTNYTKFKLMPLNRLLLTFNF